jgi:N-succinyl-L-ornithine transcarbamylase
VKHFFSVEDVDNLDDWVEEAFHVKANPHGFRQETEHRSICLIFLNPSLRTRLSTQRAAQNLGMEVAVFDVGSGGWKLEFADGTIMDGDKAEHVKEAAGVISAYFDLIGVRAFANLEDRDIDYEEEILTQFMKHSTVPVINLESASLHPLQSFADLITIREEIQKARPKVVLSWAPHPRALPQAVANSFAQWMRKADVDLVVTHPRDYELSIEFVPTELIEYDQRKAFEGADVIYAKNWSCFNVYGEVMHEDSSWMINMDKMKLTNNAKFMHCLPVRRNVVVSDEVLDSEHSVVIEQAKNRIVSVQTVIRKLLHP